MSLSFGHRFSASPVRLPGCLPFAHCGFAGFGRFPRCLFASCDCEFANSFVIKNGTESGHRLDNYIFHIVQIANDCCCGNLITLHLMKRQLMPHDRVPYTHTHAHSHSFALFKLFCSLFMTFSVSECFFFPANTNIICICWSTILIDGIKKNSFTRTLPRLALRIRNVGQ